MRKSVACLLLLPLLAAASPHDEDFPAIPPAIPDAWIGFFEKAIPPDQKIGQTVVADLDGDGVEEWIVLGEPRQRGQTWVHIYAPAVGTTPPKLAWRSPLYGDGYRTIRGFVTELRPFAQVLVVVQAEPFHNGDSRFRVQVIGWQTDMYRQLVPEPAEFRSQGGFTIERAKEDETSDTILVWTYLREPDELLYDYHRYEYNRYRYDGVRFVGQDHWDATRVKHPNPESAGKEAGASGPDLRRRIDGIAEVP